MLTKKLLTPFSAFLSGVIIVICLAISVFVNQQRSIKARRWVIHTRDVISDLDKILSRLLLLESDQRLFQLLGEVQKTNSYTKSSSEIAQTLASLRTLTSDNSVQQRNLDHLGPLVRAKLDFISTVMDLVRTHHLERASQLVREGTGQRLHDDIEQLLQKMTEEEERLLILRTSREEVAARTLEVLTVVFAALSLALLLFAAIATHREIRRRDKTENALRRSEQRFRLLINSVTDYAIFMLNPEGIISSWNEGAQRIKGYTSEEIIGKSFSIFYPREVAASGHPQYELRVATEKGHYTEENWRIRKDGSRFWAQVSITAVRDESGKLLGFAKVTRDMTERRHNEKLLEQQARKLKGVNEELESFAHSVAHDLRAPLRAMQGFSEALLEDYEDKLDTEGKDCLRRVVTSAKEMDQLIQDLLTYSRLSREEVKLEPIGLSQVTLSALRQLKNVIDSTGAIVNLEPNLPAVNGNMRILTQALTNLISNAIKFVPLDQKPVVSVGAEQREHRVKLWIEDNGIGIAPEHTEKIFRMFERLHGSEAYPGTGVGLAIVKKAAERMGGTAGVRSEPGKGSRFWLELPELEAGGSTHGSQ